MEPTTGTISQVFGANAQWAHQFGYGHLGTDWAVNIGTPVVAISDGTVTFANFSQFMSAAQANQYMQIPGSTNSGIVVFVQHDGWVSMHCHLSRSDLNPGDRVKRGQIIGWSGNTGLSTGPHLHFEVFVPPASSTPKFSRYEPMNQIAHEDRVAGASALAANERMSGPNPAFMRDRAHPDGGVVRTIPPNSREKFTGYVIADQPTTVGGVTSAVWFVDNGDDGQGARRHVWAGMFTTQVTAGLPNLTPKKPDPAAPVAAPLAVNQRRVGSNAAATMRMSARVETKPSNATGRVAAADTVENFTHWFRGQMVDLGGVKTDLWYRDSKEWAWAGSFTKQDTAGLVEWAPAPTTTVPPKTDVAPKAYTFAKAVAMVTEVVPAAVGNFEYGNIDTPPSGVYLHQFNANQPSENAVTNKDTVHIGSVRNAFTTTDRVASAHFGVEGTTVLQFVALTDRAYHGGAKGNDQWSIEIYGGMDPATVATVVRLIVALEGVAKGKLNLHRHSEAMATKCGANVDLNMFGKLVEIARTPAPPVVAPPVVPPVVVVPVVSGTAKLVQDLTAVVGNYNVTEKK